MRYDFTYIQALQAKARRERSGFGHLLLHFARRISPT